MTRYNQVKKNLAYHSRRNNHSRHPSTFMEFVHREEERQEIHAQEMKKRLSQAGLVGQSPDSQASSHIQDTSNPPPAPLISLVDLLLTGILIFIVISMLLLFMN